MNALALQRIIFHIDEPQNNDSTAYFAQDGEQYSRLELLELEETEYCVGDNPLTESISGYIGLHLVRKAGAQTKCPYGITVHTNLMRNEASAQVYEYADQLLVSLKSAIEIGKPCQLEITKDLQSTGWCMTCN